MGLNIWDNVLSLLENRGCRHPRLKLPAQVKAIFTTVDHILYITKFKVLNVTAKFSKIS